MVMFDKQRYSLWGLLVLLGTSVPCMQQCSNVDVIPLSYALSVHPEIQYQKVHDQAPFYYEKLPISPWPTDHDALYRLNDCNRFFTPRQGIFAQTYVLTVPQGMIFGRDGFLRVGSAFIYEFFNQNIMLFAFLKHIQDACLDEKAIKKISGKVAVLAHPLGTIFGHWFNEVVARLIILQQSGVSYDYLYAPCCAEYMKTTYEIFGVPAEKIIDSSSDVCYVQADELIIPSLGVNRVSCDTDPVYDCWASTDFWQPWMLQEVKKRFDPVIAAHKNAYNFSSKVFVSRQDAPGRKMLNEHEIFALFEPLGFVRYDLSKMSLIEQAVLFRGADYVVAAHGSGLANIIFCSKQAKVVEIFQCLYDSSLYNLAQDMGCQYCCIQTQSYSCGLPFMQSTSVDSNIIEDFIQHSGFMCDKK